MKAEVAALVSALTVALLREALSALDRRARRRGRTRTRQEDHPNVK